MKALSVRGNYIMDMIAGKRKLNIDHGRPTIAVHF